MHIIMLLGVCVGLPLAIYAVNRCVARWRDSRLAKLGYGCKFSKDCEVMLVSRVDPGHAVFFNGRPPVSLDMARQWRPVSLSHVTLKWLGFRGLAVVFGCSATTRDGHDYSAYVTLVFEPNDELLCLAVQKALQAGIKEEDAIADDLIPGAVAVFHAVAALNNRARMADLIYVEDSILSAMKVPPTVFKPYKVMLEVTTILQAPSAQEQALQDAGVALFEQWQKGAGGKRVVTSAEPAVRQPSGPVWHTDTLIGLAAQDAIEPPKQSSKQ